MVLYFDRHKLQNLILGPCEYIETGLSPVQLFDSIVSLPLSAVDDIG